MFLDMHGEGGPVKRCERGTHRICVPIKRVPEVMELLKTIQIPVEPIPVTWGMPSYGKTPAVSLSSLGPGKRLRVPPDIAAKIAKMPPVPKQPFLAATAKSKPVSLSSLGPGKRLRIPPDIAAKMAKKPYTFNPNFMAQPGYTYVDIQSEGPPKMGAPRLPKTSTSRTTPVTWGMPSYPTTSTTQTTTTSGTTPVTSSGRQSMHSPIPVSSLWNVFITKLTTQYGLTPKQLYADNRQDDKGVTKLTYATRVFSEQNPNIGIASLSDAPNSRQIQNFMVAMNDEGIDFNHVEDQVPAVLRHIQNEYEKRYPGQLFIPFDLS